MAYGSNINGYVHRLIEKAGLKLDRRVSRTLNYKSIKRYVLRGIRRGVGEDQLQQDVTASINRGTYRCMGRFYLPLGFRRAYRYLGNLLSYRKGLYDPSVQKKLAACDQIETNLQGTESLPESQSIIKDVKTASSYSKNIRLLRNVNLIGGYKAGRLESRLRRRFNRRCKDLSYLVSDSVAAIA